MRRMETLASCARAMTVLSDRLVTAVHVGDQEAIGRILGQARQLRPPHGFDFGDVLAICLAAQVDPGVPLEQRVGWLEQQEHQDVA